MMNVCAETHYSLTLDLTLTNLTWGWLCSRVVSVLDSGAERLGFKSQPRRCLGQTAHTHDHRAFVHQAVKLVAAFLRVARVTAGLAESNGSLPPGLWLTSPAGWLLRTGISSGTIRSVIEYGLPYLNLTDVVFPMCPRETARHGHSFKNKPAFSFLRQLTMWRCPRFRLRATMSLRRTRASQRRLTWRNGNPFVKWKFNERMDPNSRCEVVIVVGPVGFHSVTRLYQFHWFDIFRILLCGVPVSTEPKVVKTLMRSLLKPGPLLAQCWVAHLSNSYNRPTAHLTRPVGHSFSLICVVVNYRRSVVGRNSCRERRRICRFYCSLLFVRFWLVGWPRAQLMRHSRVARKTTLLLLASCLK